MTRVFVSGCYDLLHAGHLQFFRDARALGSHLTVCFASAEVLWAYKQRKSSLPDEHKAALLAALNMVDEVVIGRGNEPGLDFRDDFLRLRPDILAVTEDDQFGAAKRELCALTGARYVALPKTKPKFAQVSSSEIVRFMRAPREAPLRVDFAGGWLDVPRFARVGAFIVNCAISPRVSLRGWPYEKNAGLGGSGAWALLNGRDGVKAEAGLGVGWQDPAVITESGLCVWRSGGAPDLEIKTDGAMLRGRMALLWTGSSHDTGSAVSLKRDFDAIERAGCVARDAVWRGDIDRLAGAVRLSYAVQRGEGMKPLPGDADFSENEARPPGGAIAWKYSGSGHGGYALYLFENAHFRDAACLGQKMLPIEPFVWKEGVRD